MSVSLMALFDGIAALPDTDLEVLDLALDSRAVRSGTVFFALRGQSAHGLEFAADAIARGACAIVWESARPDAADVPDALAVPDVLAASLAGAQVYAAEVPNLSRMLGRVADRFFGQPSAKLRVTAITGTNGKTTCAYVLAQALEALGVAAAYIGTIGWGRVHALRELSHTTPDVITLHRMLANLLAGGVTDVAMEVSSHALDQGRIDGVRLHTAAFTNLTRDHLDYHGSMQAYGAAKARLFRTPGLAHIVLNVGDAFGRNLAHVLGSAVPVTAIWMDSGIAGGGEQREVEAQRKLYAVDVQCSVDGVTLDVDGSFGALALSTRLLGRFNAENVLVVMACLGGFGVSIERAAAAVETSQAAPGRMEVVTAAASEPGKQYPIAVIDYAHTPDALAKALAALREHCQGTLWCVFGCGGDRDAGKRPLMGAVVDDLADAIIVTDDNPRSEDAARITADILAGIRVHAAHVIHDRAQAITMAIGTAHTGDVVLIAGKGDEDYQIYGRTRRAFSDRREAQRALGVAA